MDLTVLQRVAQEGLGQHSEGLRGWWAMQWTGLWLWWEKADFGMAVHIGIDRWGRRPAQMPRDVMICSFTHLFPSALTHSRNVY